MEIKQYLIIHNFFIDTNISKTNISQTRMTNTTFVDVEVKLLLIKLTNFRENRSLNTYSTPKH